MRVNKSKIKIFLYILTILCLGVSIFYNVKMFNALYYPTYPKITFEPYDYTKEVAILAADICVYDGVPFNKIAIIQNMIGSITKHRGVCYLPLDEFKNNDNVTSERLDDNMSFVFQRWFRTSKDSMNRALKYMLYRRVKDFNPYRLIVVNSLERKLKSGEAPYPDAISEKDLPVIFAKYTEIYYLMQKDYVLSKLDSILIKEAKKKKIPVTMDYY